MKMPLVSVVMPTMNSGQFLMETLNTMMAQKYVNFELIAVDGGSTDDTLDILDQYSDGDIKIIELAPGLGIAKALNVGIAAAEGLFIARMDADDLAYEWRLHDQVKFMTEHGDIDLIGTGVDAFWDHEGVFRSPLSYQSIRDEYLANNPFFHPTLMFRRRIVDNGLFRYNEANSFEEDYELWGRLIPQIKCANMDQSSIRYRIRGNSTQWDPRKYRFKQMALKGFCAFYDIKDQELIDALVEFQCGAFIRSGHYAVMRDYAASIAGTEMPRLGWIHNALVEKPDYLEFTKWFRSAKGWPA
jgi:glycosyltransferase involved in cell wall biosynthesis